MDFPVEYSGEWPAGVGPVRTIERKVIVPGTYGIILLFDSAMHGKVHIGANPCHAGPDELREAARIFIEIADAIDAGAST